MTMLEKALAILTAVLVVLILEGCATPWVGEPYGVPFKEFEPIPVEAQPGDDEAVQVTVGQMRQALAVAEQFDLLVPHYNENVGYANQIASRYDELLEHNRRLYRYGKVAPWVGAGVGGFVTALVFSMAR